MSIIKRHKKYWIDFRFNGQRIRQCSPDNTHAGAKAYELLIRQKLARGEPLRASNTQQKTFRVFAIEWLETYVKNNNKPSEVNNRKSAMTSSLIPFFGTKLLNDIKSYDVERYKNELLNRSLSPKTVNNRLCILSRCLKTAIEWELIEKIPKIKLLKVPPQSFDYLSTEETEEVLLKAEPFWYEVILVALMTGLRFGELIALRWSSVDFERKLLTVSKSIVNGIESSPKSNKIRTIPLTSQLVEMLERKDQTNEYIFHYRNKPLGHDYCLDALHNICDKAGIRRIGWHKLRHTFASRLAENNVSIIAIKELLGHADIKTTMRYAHINLSVLQASVRSLENNFGHNMVTGSNRVLELEP